MNKLNLDGNKVEELDEIMGIDLGTTNCAVAVYTKGTVPTLVKIGGQDKFTLPSCVMWNEDGTFTVGVEAYKQRYKENVCYSVKRIMGSDKMVELHNANGTMRMTPASVSSEILKAIKKQVAELYKPLTKCVITVPAYFNQRQIEDTIAAAKMADLDCIQILKEPTSASYIYSMLGYAMSGSVVIYDLGGGTFDVTHMNFLRKDAIPSTILTSLKQQYGITLDSSGADNTDQYFCRVLGTYGDINLGGDDIDKYMGDAIIKRDNLKLTDEEREILYLRCEEFKKIGAAGLDVTIGDKSINLSKEMLDEAVDEVFRRTLDIMADIDMSDVNAIVLVGGSTKSKRLREDLQNEFPNIPISAVLDPDATVALGAGAVAKAIANNDDLMYSDVLPLPIGILVDEKSVEMCISQNTSLPYSVVKSFRTLHDNQERVEIDVYQGLSSNPKNCTYLGRMSVTGLPPKPAGETVVFVTFILNGQGRLKIMTRVDGVEKEAELIIDNIFSVNTENGATAEKSDAFEEVALMNAGKDNKEVNELLAVRRKKLANGEDVSEIEDKITDLVFG